VAGKVTAGLAESNDSLPTGGELIVTCGLTVCTPGSASGPTLGNEYEKYLLFSIDFGEKFNAFTIHTVMCRGGGVLPTSKIFSWDL